MPGTAKNALLPQLLRQFERLMSGDLNRQGRRAIFQSIRANQGNRRMLAKIVEQRLNMPQFTLMQQVTHCLGFLSR